MRTPFVVTSVLLVLGSAAVAGTAAGATYSVVESKSSVRIHVGKSGAFSFAGHRHEVQAPVSGTVTADPANLSASSVDLTFASGRLRVLPGGEPSGDAPKVEKVMHGPEVLDAVRFPEIHFRSKKITGRTLSGGAYELSLVGELSLHGVTQEITVPVKITLDGRSLTAAGQTTLRHDQFGMKPVTAGGGTVKVANDIHIDFQIVAEQR
jgi:polyisoprenoid-binding protein YceI